MKTFKDFQVFRYSFFRCFKPLPSHYDPPCAIPYKLMFYRSRYFLADFLRIRHPKITEFRRKIKVQVSLPVQSAYLRKFHRIRY